MKNVLNRLWSEEEGQDLVEYGLLLTLIALAAISDIFSQAATNLTSVVS